MITWEVILYDLVEFDGKPEISRRLNSGQFITIEDPESDVSVIVAAGKAGLMGEVIHFEAVDIDGDEEVILVRVNDVPKFELHRHEKTVH